MRKILKACNVAFSMYSKIPMPRFVWGTEDMRYHLCFFPLVGAVVGAFCLGWYSLFTYLSMSRVTGSLVALAIPLLLTGGFHVDGFMDTMDALSSYQEREKKLEILKDPHIGAFSVITLFTAVLLAAGCLIEVKAKPQALCLCGCFIISRALSGLCVMSLPSAKQAGMLKTTMDTAGKSTVKTVLVVESLLTVGGLLWISPLYGGAVLLAMGLTLLWFVPMTKKNFGGITGDLEGCFVVISEIVSSMLVCAAGFLPLG